MQRPAGAPCLNPRTECLNTKSSADWATAQQTATNAISLNSSTGVQLASGTVEYGYWNLTGTCRPAVTPMTPGSNDRPAVKVTLSRSTGQNGGPVPTFFARIFGTTSMPVSATAVAVFSIPGYAGHGSLFPVAITKCLYDNYWNSTTHSPMTATSTTSPRALTAASPKSSASLTISRSPRPTMRDLARRTNGRRWTSTATMCRRSAD